MDDRQRQIREGAGQLESRLNEEFIEFLQRWSMPLLVVLAVGAVGYAGWTRYKKGQIEKVNTAFQEFESASSSTNPSPDSLRRVADEYDGVRSVSHLARLSAADTYLKAIRQGVKPGAELKPDGTFANAADALTEQDITSNLNQANQLYQQVAEGTTGNAGLILIRVSAIYGQASVAESRKLPDEAQKFYEQIITLTENGPFAVHAKIAKERIAGLKSLDTNIKAFTKAELPELPPVPGAEKPPTPESEAEAPAGTRPAEPSTPDAPKTDAPRTDSPKPDAAKPESPKSEVKPELKPEPKAEPAPAPK